MKNTLLVTKIFDRMQGHRFVEPVVFGSFDGINFALLSSWRYMLRRHALLVLEFPDCCQHMSMETFRRVRQDAAKAAGLNSWWRPQSWAYLLLGANAGENQINAVYLPKSCLGFSSDTGCFFSLSGCGANNHITRLMLPMNLLDQPAPPSHIPI